MVSVKADDCHASLTVVATCVSVTSVPIVTTSVLEFIVMVIVSPATKVPVMVRAYCALVAAALFTNDF